MKLRTTTPASSLSYAMRIGITVSVIIMAVSVPIQFFSNRPVSADAYDAKINALREKISGYESQANELRKKADTLQNTLDQLSTDKAKIQTEINLYQAEYDQLVRDIKATQEKIDENRRVSGELIVKSSLSEDIPLIVRLASSDNLADYIDGEVNRISVRDTIVQKTEENEKLKVQLKDKQAEVKKVLDSQKLKRDELASKEATQQRLIAQTQNDEASYQKLIASGKDQIKKYQQMQQELRNRQGIGSGSYVTVGGSGGYPWANVGYPCWSAGCSDPWQVYYRECVSYVAWKLSSQGYGVKPFGGYGHAYQWPDTTQGRNPGSGITKPYTQLSYGTNPSRGDAAILPAYTGGAAWTGHVMYVEEVYGDGSIRVSEYNWSGDGRYSERKFSSSEYGAMIFITFPRR